MRRPPIPPDNPQKNDAKTTKIIPPPQWKSFCLADRWAAEYMEYKKREQKPILQNMRRKVHAGQVKPLQFAVRISPSLRNPLLLPRSEMPDFYRKHFACMNPEPFVLD
jgi:hypothetical protein